MFLYYFFSIKKNFMIRFRVKKYKIYAYESHLRPLCGFVVCLPILKEQYFYLQNNTYAHTEYPCRGHTELLLTR